MKELQKKVNDIYTEVFNYTPQSERISDITNQFFKLIRNTGVKDLKESTGDLLTSLIQLSNESDWNIEDLVNDNLEKINRRKLQYKALGRKKSVAIMGGAFNPCHKGHIQVAQFVLNTSGAFDEVWIMPAYKHMYNKDLESSEDRLKMCELAASIDARIKIFDYEIRHKLAGETFKLVKQLKNDPEYENFDFSFIMGLDNANTFNKWVNYEHLEKMMKFVVVPRKGTEMIPSVNWYLQKPHIWLMNEKFDILECSSTLVRSLVKENNSKELETYMNKDVIDYILKNKLYV